MNEVLTLNTPHRVALFVARERRIQRVVMRETYRLLMPKSADGDPSALFSPRIFEFSPNKLSLQERIERAHLDGCTVFVVGGQWVAVLTRDICKEMAIAPVVVCIGVTAKALGQDGRGGRMVTISGELYSGAPLATFLLQLKGHINRIFLPCLRGGSGGALKAEVQKIKEILEQEGMHVEAVEVESLQEVMRMVKERCGTFDLLLALEACAVNDVLGLARFCAENNVLFWGGYGSDSIDAGAAGAYGGDIVCLAAHAVEAVEDVLIRGKSPQEVGDKIVPYCRYFMINRVLLLQAGLPLELLDTLAAHEDALVVRKFVNFEEAL